MKRCSECLEENDEKNNFCVYCGHKLKKIDENNPANKNYCQLCGERVDVSAEYCGEYGHKIDRNTKFKVCAICGEEISIERYCWNCGHDDIHNSNVSIDKRGKGLLRRTKKCPNCNGINGMRGYPEFFYYCEDCGTKLVKK